MIVVVTKEQMELIKADPNWKPERNPVPILPKSLLLKRRKDGELDQRTKHYKRLLAFSQIIGGMLDDNRSK